MAESYPTAPQVEIVEEPTVYLPRHNTFHISIVATEQKGSAPGELYHLGVKLSLWRLESVAVHGETHQIFIANGSNSRVEILSETGEFLYQLGVGQLSRPRGITTHGDSVYVSCLGNDTVSKFSLTEMCCVKRIGGKGSDNGQFTRPRQLTTDHIGRVFIADDGNSRICIHDPDLNHLRNITHESMFRPYDVKVSRDRLYVLCPDKNPCMMVLTLEGDKLHFLISNGRGMDLLRPFCFCLDPLNNFIISDFMSHSIRVFSPEGNLLHTIGKQGHQPGLFFYPDGVALIPNRRLACVSWNRNFGLQIFC